MFALGMLHDGGHDVKTDREEARRWFARATKCGHPLAALMLARYAMRGFGGPEDIESARRWYAYAATLGAPQAEAELAALNQSLTLGAGTHGETSTAPGTTASHERELAVKEEER